MDSKGDALPIEREKLEQFRERANHLLASVKWTPSKPIDNENVAKSSSPQWRESSSAPTTARECSILKAAREVAADPLLLPEGMNHALRTYRLGLQVGMSLSNTYTRFSGLDQLITLNSRGGLADAQKAEFRAKYHTAAAIAAFVSAYFVCWDLGSYKPEEVGSVELDYNGLPEFTLRDPVSTLDCITFYYANYLEDRRLVRDELSFVKLTTLYFQSVLDEIQLRRDSLKYTEPFEGQNYKLEASEFTISGFEVDIDRGEEAIEFNRVELSDIVGNRDAKHDARRLVERLLCYDLETKKNPMQALGGLSAVTMGFGPPGTGKSMLISAIATMLQDHSKELGIPFLFWPMPDTVVSTFQGGSAERMLNWMKPLRDPSKLIYAPIDDAENNLEERSRQGVSAGVREVIAVFLRNTEGAYAVNHGNSVIQLFTNLPDQIDKAVLSRINRRTYIGGAEEFEDFLDQDYLWLRKHRELAPDFVNMKDPESYEYLSQQKPLRSMGELAEQTSEAKHPLLQKIFSRIRDKHSADEHTFFAQLFLEVKKDYPLFTSRDLRNIQRAIDQRILDFDFPENWLANPELFFRKSYDEKHAMIIELMKENMGKLSFAQLRFEESLRYLESMAEIADTGKERKLDQLTEELLFRREAERRAVDQLKEGT